MLKGFSYGGFYAVIVDQEALMPGAASQLVPPFEVFKGQLLVTRMDRVNGNHTAFLRLGSACAAAASFTNSIFAFPIRFWIFPNVLLEMRQPFSTSPGSMTQAHFHGAFFVLGNHSKCISDQPTCSLVGSRNVCGTIRTTEHCLIKKAL